MARGFNMAAAQQALVSNDPSLATWIDRLGPLATEPRWHQSFEPVDALARSILYQQLSGKAAATIVGRVEIAANSTRLDAAALGAIDDLALRACGVSGNKLLALRDLARRHQAGELPTPRQMSRMDDEQIIAALSAVRGIGRWTAEMLLIFRLGRPDVLPLDDLGIRRGLQRMDRLDTMPGLRETANRGEQWRPHRTLASLYLWRIADAVGVD